MPYEIESYQQRKLTEQGSLELYGDRTHAGEFVYVNQGYRDDSNRLVWRNVWTPALDYLAGYQLDTNFAPLV